MSGRPPTYVVRVVHGPDAGSTVVVDRATPVGRQPGGLELTDERVSRRHAELSPAEGGVLVRDLGSAHGTTVRGHLVGDGRIVRQGETVEIGASVLRVYRVGCSQPATDTSFEVRVDGSARPVDDVAGSFVVGRDPACGVVLDLPTVSRRHATFSRDGSTWWVADHSANGTFVNGQRVAGSHQLSTGDLVTFGRAAAVLAHRATTRFSGVRVRLGAEGRAERHAVEISVGGQSTVADILDPCVASLGLDPRDPHVLMRPGAGLMLAGDAQFADAGIEDGEELVVGVGEVPTVETAVALRPRPSRSPVDQLPRREFPPSVHEVTRPEMPETTSWRGRGVIWQIASGGAAMAAGVALSILRPAYKVFGLIMVAGGLMTLVVSLVSDNARRRRRFADYERRLGIIDADLARVCAQQAEALRAVSPDDVALIEMITARSSRLWERRTSDADVLALRVGTGRRRARITSTRPGYTTFGRHEGHEFEELLARHAELTDVPICTPGPGVAVVGLVGPRERVAALAARMVLETAALHPPDRVRIWILADGRAWSWARWLPHVADGQDVRVSRSAAEANALALRLMERERAVPQAGARTRAVTEVDLVVVPPGSSSLANVVQLTRAGLGGAGQILAYAEAPRDLPSGTQTVVVVGEDGTATMSGDHDDPPVGSFALPRLSFDDVQRLATEFASMRLAGGSTPAGAGGLVDLVTGAPLASLEQRTGWDDDLPWGPMASPIGVADDDSPVVLDFRRDGPHGMIAGTTGSGKSELLQTLLAGLVLGHSPAQLNLFLIDFKGGATFAPVADLPHVVGLVTDLETEPGLATRAFTALDAEIERRKRILETAQVPNIIDYERLGDERVEPMPNLLVVIDEFALLVRTQPELRDRLDTVATQGRSLGVHLLLATQSPTGVITNAIRMNTNLWLCLRVVSESESTELLGTRDAARIATDRPGRGFVRKGASETVTGFQAARIGRDVEDGSAVATVEVRAFVDDPAPNARVERRIERRGRRRTELDVLVEAVERWSAHEAPARPLWTPPLPVDLDPATIPPIDLPSDRLAGVLGMVDIPERQVQLPAVVDLSASGNGVVVGVLGSGKSTALKQLAIDLAERHPVDDLHVYAIDAGAGSLAEVGSLPHCAAVVSVGDVERLVRTLDRLARLIEQRRDELTVQGGVDFLAHRLRTTPRRPWVLLLVDDVATFRAAVETIQAGRLNDVFADILRSGPAVGVHTVVAASQTTDIRMTQMNLLLHRVVLRAGDVVDFQLVDQRLRAEQFSRWPPGRGVVRGGHAIQIARPSAATIAALAARRAATPAGALPPAVLRLPTDLALDDLPPVRLDPGQFVLGLGGDDCEPVVVDLERGSGTLLVVGPSQSGRSTALLSATRSMLDRAPGTRVVAIAPRRSPARELAGHPAVDLVATSPEEISAAWASIRSAHGVLVLVDDAEALPPSADLEPLLRAAPDTGNRFLVAARTTDLQNIYDPWSKYLQSQRFAIALQPGPAEAYLLGFRAVADTVPFPVGRGVLAERGTTTVVQVHRTAVAAFSGASAPTFTIPSTQHTSPGGRWTHEKGEQTWPSTR